MTGYIKNFYNKACSTLTSSCNAMRPYVPTALSNNWDKCKRCFWASTSVLCHIPYRRIKTPATVGMGALYTSQSAQQTLSARNITTFTKNGSDLLNSAAMTINAYLRNTKVFIGTTLYLAGKDICGFGKKLYEGKYKESARDFLSATNNLVYLWAVLLKKPWMMAGSCIIEVVNDAYLSMQNFKNGKYIEGAAKCLIGALHTNSTYKRLQDLATLPIIQNPNNEKASYSNSTVLNGFCPVLSDRNVHSSSCFDMSANGFNSSYCDISPSAIACTCSESILRKNLIDRFVPVAKRTTELFLQNHPLRDIEGLLKNSTVISTGDRDLDFGSCIYPYGGGMVKWGNLCFKKTIGDRVEMKFKLNHVHRKMLQEQIDALISSPALQEDKGVVLRESIDLVPTTDKYCRLRGRDYVITFEAPENYVSITYREYPYSLYSALAFLGIDKETEPFLDCILGKDGSPRCMNWLSHKKAHNFNLDYNIKWNDNWNDMDFRMVAEKGNLILKKLYMMQDHSEESAYVECVDKSPDFICDKNYELKMGHISMRIGSDEYLYNLYDNISVKFPKGQSLESLYKALSVVGLESSLLRSTEDDLERMKIGQLFRIYHPREATPLERTKIFFDLPIDSLKKRITSIVPSMEESFRKKLSKMEICENYTGGMRYCLRGLSDEAYKIGARALLVGINVCQSEINLYDRNERCFSALTSMLNSGLLSSQALFDVGFGLDSSSKLCASDQIANVRTGGGDSVYSHIVLDTHIEKKLEEYLFVGTLDMIISLKVLETGTYQAHDMNLSRGTRNSDTYFNRPSHIEFINAERNLLHDKEEGFINRVDEVMVKTSISPDLIISVVMSRQKIKDDLLSRLREEGLIQLQDGQEIFRGKPVDEFFLVGEKIEEKMLEKAYPSGLPH